MKNNLIYISLIIFVAILSFLNNREKTAQIHFLERKIEHLTIQRDTIATKYLELLRYENGGFKKRVQKFCPCLD